MKYARNMVLLSRSVKCSPRDTGGSVKPAWRTGLGYELGPDQEKQILTEQEQAGVRHPALAPQTPWFYHRHWPWTWKVNRHR